ncbi:ComF family protein [Corynebacterium falsenii]|uniref:ComF family protein n=1 Tax=Corynebacterium falsenii TaxID=108486 RepID=UPI00046D6AB0|nr:ComF family protein [Corynebacterium falsenii]UBI04435.1 ComF family protein [Corynebacterium falsenii]
MWGLVDLVWRTDCMCCGQGLPPALARREVCDDCALDLAEPWQRWNPPTSLVPVYTAGAYGGARRSLIIAAKERLRGAAAVVGGRMLAAGLESVAGRGLIAHPRLAPVILVPAPTRASAARARGGDIVTAMAREVSRKFPLVQVAPCLHLAEGSRDSVGLGRGQRRENVAAAVRVNSKSVESVRRAGEQHVVVVDDVCTTGATITQSALALAAHGVRVSVALAIAGA